MNKKGLDEMQLHRRNKVGNQTFILLLYLLMIDAGLYGFGFRWVSYPANTMIILSICSSIYVVRLIIGNAYVGPSAEKEKPVLKVFITTLISVIFAITILFLLRNTSFSSKNQIDDMSAPILFITAAIAIVIVVTISIIKKIQNKSDGE